MNTFTEHEIAKLKQLAADATGSDVVERKRERKERAKKERTPEQIEADKERMAKLREQRKSKTPQ